jgi:hypothetical protein
MSFGGEHEGHETAREIESQRPGWMVVWGIYTKEYVAFPLFHAPEGTVVIAVYPEALVARMEAAERTAKGATSCDRIP